MSARLKEGMEHQKANRFEQAAQAYRDVLAKQPNQPDAMHFLGLALWNLPQQSEAPLKLIRRSMELAPDQPQMHHNLASVLGSLGKIDEAIEHFRRAIELKPDYAEAFFNLGGIMKFCESDREIGQMKTLYADLANEMSQTDREYLCYGLSKACNDVGHYEEAFHFALEASRLKAVVHDTGAVDRALSELKQSMTQTALAPKKNRGHSSDAPIFIVGMPRSGTTLVEQILSRHSDVFAAGELPMIGSINDQMRRWAMNNLGFKGSIYGFIPQMPDDHINQAAAASFNMVVMRAAGKKFLRFTDKMPQNASRLGLVSQMFPNARVVHVRRYPLDTCISCFFQRFRLGQEYSYRLDWLGHYYRFTELAMEHWKKVVPLPILDVHYEDLVSDPENQVRRLVEFAGLEWQDSCLAPQDSDRSILTASRWQVRQPIYKTSIDRWKRYEAYLEPLIKSLGGMDWINRQIRKN